MNELTVESAVVQATTENLASDARPETYPADRFRRARQEWDERFEFHAQAARQWRRLGLAGVVFGLMGIGYAIWVDGQSELKPFIVMVDDLGQTETVREIVTVEDWPVPVIKRDLSDFVSWTRSVPADREVLISNFTRAFHYLSDGDPAFTMIKEIGRHSTLSAFRVAESRTRSVEIISVNFVGGNSWLVEWRETTRSRSTGKISDISEFKGTYVLKEAKRRSEEILSYNPLGMMVEHFDIQKLN